MKVVRTGKGFIAGKVKSTGNRISGTVQAAVEDSRTGIPQEPWTPGLGTENQQRGDRAAWEPGLPGGTTDHEVRKV